ncbi:hypothetical protein ABMA28_012574 [Loxostege sticticalis]|uniref:Uncharacterized protein n=1 Tax=Loxostege sticticalis TaxID=481309 RepID=A0ABD0S4U1_LOXSC
MCSFVPLRLICGEDVIWQNPRPSSTLLCRPIYFKFVNENKLDIKEEMAMVEAEITALKPSVISNNINVKHSMLMTMIDGKIASHLSQTSMQTCDICKAVPSEMNDLKKIKENISSDLYKYGLSTLHAWIRCMECMLHIAYRLEFKKWQARDEASKTMMKNRKLSIQQKFRDQMGLLIDVVKQGAGTTNDGNTARTFFRNPEKTADITGLSPELIQKFAVILRVVSSGQPINTDTFADYAQKTAQLYVELYSWYFMPASVHKLLLHGAEIIKHFSILPIGQLSEEASEARNKDFRKIREHHTRKFSRVATNEDIFNGFITSSDPYLSSIRPVLKKNYKRQVTDEMKLLLLSDNSLDQENVEFVDVTNMVDSDFSEED